MNTLSLSRGLWLRSIQIRPKLQYPQSCVAIRRTLSYDSRDKKEEGTFAKLVSNVRLFNNGISRLKSDFFISLHIRAANETRLNLERKFHKQNEARKHKVSASNVEECPKLINRRQRWLSKHLPQATTRRAQRHMIQTTKDLQTTLPTVLGFLIPVAGYSFLILGIMFPKVLLSRQFHTDEQRREFAMDELRTRRGWFKVLAKDFWGTFMMDSRRAMARVDKMISGLTYDHLLFEDFDTAGPVLNKSSILYLYELCHKLLTSSHQPSNAFYNLPLSHLHSLSHACYIPSIFPSSHVASNILHFFIPRWFLESRLAFMAEDIIIDDVTLIEEGHLGSGCSNLTDDEILAACLVRGLPVGRFARDDSIGGMKGEILHMKRSLTNHLKMMKGAMMIRERFAFEGENAMVCEANMVSKRSLVRDHTLQLLVLHLPAIRFEMRPS